MNQYVCTICGFVYDEAVGIPSSGIAPGTKWEDLPKDWVCPLCGASKSDFKLKTSAQEKAEDAAPIQEFHGDLRKLSTGELSALFSNLARGCDKQHLGEEASLFTTLADYFKQRTPSTNTATIDQLMHLITQDMDAFDAANAAAKADGDRGAQRALVWSEKVTRMTNSILSRYSQEGDAFLENANIYVCESCGFIYVGDAPPALCPVCKVPNWKLQKIERR